MTFARLPQRILKRGLRYIFYSALVLFSFTFSFATNQQQAHAAGDAIDLTLALLFLF